MFGFWRSFRGEGSQKARVWRLRVFGVKGPSQLSLPPLDGRFEHVRPRLRLVDWYEAWKPPKP